MRIKYLAPTDENADEVGVASLSAQFVQSSSITTIVSAAICLPDDYRAGVSSRTRSTALSYREVSRRHKAERCRSDDM
jgi:hypothetical protein